MKKILYVFYRYYNDGPTKSVAYVKTITVFLLLLFINLLAIITFLGLQLPNMKDKSTLLKYLFFLVLYLLPGYIIVSLLVKRKDLEDKKLEADYKKFEGWLLIGYALLSVFLLVLAVKFKS